MTPAQAIRMQSRLGVVADGRPGQATYSALFARFGAASNASILGAGAAKHFPVYGISDQPLRIAHWIAQFAHESGGFTKFEEALSYRAQRLMAVWPRRFPTLAAATPYANSPERLANAVYGGRMGNLSNGDGWRYRGRGPQLTGRDNYAVCAVRTGLDVLANPDLAALPENFVQIATDFWTQHHCNDAADRDDLSRITMLINGGQVGLAARKALLDKAKGICL